MNRPKAEESMQLPTFQQSIEDSAQLLAELDNGRLADGEASARIAELLAELATARGFFVSLLTGDWAFDCQIPDIVTDTIRANPEHAFNLLAKNLVMSSATVVTHRRSGELELEKGSQRVVDRSSSLIIALNEPEMAQEVRDLLTAVEDRLKHSTTTGGNAGTYGAFLERWSYNDEQMLVASNNLKKVIASLEPSKPKRLPI
jgi:hypothetical protein